MTLRVLNVAEKPSAAKEIVRVIQRGAQVSTRQTRSRFNMIYEFDTNLSGQPAHMVFTSVLGHLMSTDFEERVRRWGSCDPLILLDPDATNIQWTISDDKEVLAQTLRTEARRVDWLILWLDCDSEGEKIAFDVAQVCREGKPSIMVKRARFSAMTASDLFRALAQLDQLNQFIVNMVATRQEIDLRAGAAYTRFLTTQLQKFALSDDSDSPVISYGPCQFPTLGIVVDRWLHIHHFVSRDFWVLELFLHDCDAPFEWTRKHLFDEYVSMVLYELCYEEAEADGYVATVVKVDRMNRTRWRPLPLCTVELQKVASRVLRISSDCVMEIAEALYNKGLISYPRTETDRFATSYDLGALISRHTQHPEWGQFASRLLTPPQQSDKVTFTWPRAGRNDDGAHPPIHPTQGSPESFDSLDHKRVYDYITKRFLASCSIDAHGSATVVQMRVGSSEYFTAQGLIVEERGYLEVIHPFEKWDDKKMPQSLLRMHARIPIQSLTLRQSKTQPPPLLQEADLIALMDHHHIGTDATIAEHIKKVLERGYVEKVAGSRFSPTEMGLSLVIAHEYMQIHLARPQMRAKQEDQLKQIVDSQLQPNQVLRGALDEYRTLFQRLVANRAVIDAVFQTRFQRHSAQSWDTADPAFCSCGACGQRMALKTSSRAAPGGSGNNSNRGQNRGNMRTRTQGRPRGRNGRGGNTNGLSAAAVSGGDFDRCAHCEHCRRTLKLPRNGRLEPTGKHCPLCNYEVIRVFNNSTGAEHTVCPKCLSEPPVEVAMNPERKQSEFRCFNCTNTSCEFARGVSAGDMDVAQCPLCNKGCALRAGRESTTRFIACVDSRTTCDFVYWFPRGVISSVSVDQASGNCPACSSKKLRVEWMERSVPPGVRAFSGCIWCDPGWSEALTAIGKAHDAPKAPHPGQRGPRQRNTNQSATMRGQGRGNGWGSARTVGTGDIEDARGRMNQSRGFSWGTGTRSHSRAGRRGRGMRR